MEARLRAIPMLLDVTSDLLIENPQVAVDIDREAAGALGVSAAEIENTLYDAYGQRQVSTIYTASNEYWVVLEVLPKYQANVTSLASLYVRSARGGIVPLGSVAHFRNDVGPVTVNHSREIPAVTLSFNLAPGVSLGAAVDTVARTAAAVLPPTVYGNFSGIAAAFMSTQQGLVILLVLAVFVIYVILGALYESFVHPITILTGLPFAAFGALVTLNLAGLDLDMYGFVGMIMLVGIVEKNAIMMIDFAIEGQRRDGKTPSAAILEAASVRFRPIMMTTMAALMGALPIALGWGAGASHAPAARRGGRRRAGVLPAGDAVRDAGVLHVFRRTAAVVREAALGSPCRRAHGWRREAAGDLTVACQRNGDRLPWVIRGDRSIMGRGCSVHDGDPGWENRLAAGCGGCARVAARRDPHRESALAGLRPARLAATTHAPALSAHDMVNSDHTPWLVGVARIAGIHTMPVNALSMAASIAAARRGRIPSTTPSPAARCAAPVK